MNAQVMNVGGIWTCRPLDSLRLSKTNLGTREVITDRDHVESKDRPTIDIIEI